MNTPSPSTEVRFVIQIEVTDIEGFKVAVQRCADVSRAETGTLVYDWYLDEENGSAMLYESYASQEAVVTHVSGPVFSELGPTLMETCVFTHMDAFGDVGRLFERRTMWPTTIWGRPIASGSD